MKLEKKEKPTPKACRCGKLGILVVCRGKKMVSCPNPCSCDGNFRTTWRSNAEDAILEWNYMNFGKK